VQSSTLAGNLRQLGKAYSWAKTIGRFDLDSFLCAGRVLNARQLESLASYIRSLAANAATSIQTSPSKMSTAQETRPAQLMDTGAFDNALSVIEDFLKWSLDAMNRGGPALFTFENLILERSRIELIFDYLRIGAAPSQRITPLEDAEIGNVRSAIGPKETTTGWIFPPVFSPHTQFRNWLMFETALELGVRRGELLKLKVTSLPRGSESGIRVVRYPDDPEDTRSKEPAVKTAERIIPASRNLLHYMNIYLTSSPPIGRNAHTSPYLFVTVNGAPISIDRSNDIIQGISAHSSVALSWHRLRHTWAESTAELLFDKPDGLDQLQWLGGWTSPDSPRRYTQNIVAKRAQESIRGYQENIYR
jgi:integrase